MAAVTCTYELADGTPDSGMVGLRPDLSASDVTPVPRVVTQGSVSCVLDGSGSVGFEVLASDDDGWRLADGAPMPYVVTERLRSGTWVWRTFLMGEGPHDLALLRQQPPAPSCAVPVPVPGDQGPQGEVAVVPDAITGPPGSPVVVRDLDPSPHRALLEFEIPEGQKGPAIGGILTTKGDLVARDATTAVRVPVGSAGQVLTPDVSAPAGVRWATPVERSDLLRESVWHVDARDALPDRLPDLTGRGRDAVFGAGAAAPVVLPWTGEDYLATVEGIRGGVSGIDLAGTATVCQVVYHAEIKPRVGGTAVYLFHLGGTAAADKAWWVSLGVGSALTTVRGDGTGSQSLALGSLSPKAWHRFTYDAAMLATYEASDDGVTWSVVGTAQHTGSRAGFLTRNVYKAIGGGSTTAAPAGRWYSARFSWDGAATHIIDPANAGADYLTIANTGSAGGSFLIPRPTSGLKTAVVDRPLLVFGGAQTMTATGTVPGGGTRLRSRRAFGSGGTIGTVQTVHDGSAPALSGITEEVLAEAVWARILTPAELEKAARDLAGTEPDYVVAATVGNLLTDNQATAGDALDSLKGFTAASSTIIRTTAAAASGTGCVRATATAAGERVSIIVADAITPSAYVPVVPGRRYTGTVKLRSDAATASCRIDLSWRSADGAQVAHTYGSIVTLSPAWQESTISAIAPPGAVSAHIQTVFSGAIGEVYDADEFGWWDGVGGSWRRPGVPVPEGGAVWHIAAAIRASVTGWSIIDDAGHTPVNVTAVEVLNGNTLRVHYGRVASEVGAFIVTGDEGLAGTYLFGSSVGTTFSDIRIFKRSDGTIVDPATITADNIWVMGVMR